MKKENSPATDASISTGAIDRRMADNEIRVRPNPVIKKLIDDGLKKLSEHGSIVMVAKGQAISKAITSIEIIKRRRNGTLHQYNQLGRIAAATQQWYLMNENELDGADINSLLPAIFIHLSTTPIPELETVATYQPPSSTGSE